MTRVASNYLDLGLGSTQIEYPSRGISSSQEGLLDLPMVGRADESAADLLSWVREFESHSATYGSDRRLAVEKPYNTIGVAGA